jgi:cytochrome c
MIPQHASKDTSMKLISTIAACTATVAFSGLAFAGPAEDIIAKEKCGSCHTASTTKKGPSWASVAQKYKGDPAAQDKIATMLKTGGAEDHKKVAASDADLKAIAAVVLSSK